VRHTGLLPRFFLIVKGLTYE